MHLDSVNHNRGENYYFSRAAPAANRFAGFGESERLVKKKKRERNGALKKSQKDKTLKVISLIVLNYLD